jgi:hypothetical protein
MALRLNGSSSGYVELEVPAAAGSHTLTLPDGGGTSGQYLQTNGSGTLSWQTVSDNNTFGYTSLGETATTSGSGTTVTGIPSTATEVVLILTDISVSNTETPALALQMGDGSLDTGNNYRWSTWYQSGNQAATNVSSVRLTHTDFNAAANVYNGIIRLVFGTSNVAGNATITRSGAQTILANFQYTGASQIDRISLITSSTFDAGKYEVLHNG